MSSPVCSEDPQEDLQTGWRGGHLRADLLVDHHVGHHSNQLSDTSANISTHTRSLSSYLTQPYLPQYRRSTRISRHQRASQIKQHDIRIHWTAPCNVFISVLTFTGRAMTMHISKPDFANNQGIPIPHIRHLLDGQGVCMCS